MQEICHLKIQQNVFSLIDKRNLSFDMANVLSYIMLLSVKACYYFILYKI